MGPTIKERWEPGLRPNSKTGYLIEFQEETLIVQRITRPISVYVLWVVSIALSGLIAFYLLQVLLGFLFLKINPWQLRAIRNFGYVILGLVWLSFTIGSEWHCRKYLKLDLGIFPLVKFFALEVAVFLLVYGANLIIN